MVVSSLVDFLGIAQSVCNIHVTIQYTVPGCKGVIQHSTLRNLNCEVYLGIDIDSLGGGEGEFL